MQEYKKFAEKEIAEKIYKKDELLMEKERGIEMKNKDLLRKLADTTHTCICDEKTLELAISQLIDRYENLKENSQILNDEFSQEGTSELFVTNTETKQRYLLTFVAEESDTVAIEMTASEAEIVKRILKEANSQVQGYCGAVYFEKEYDVDRIYDEILEER